MKNIILSSAGHIDHGKTRLIQELTGKNTMHHKEEKLRNITIDLGYANMVLKNEINISIIDVPGHEDYLKNTICGILNANVVMLVISAKEGVCVQTVEHYNIINASSINHMIIAVTKMDMASDSEVKDTLRQIDILIQDSNISNKYICKINCNDKKTVDNLIDKIYSFAKDIDECKIIRNIFRIDNSFSLKGHGTIVSGNLISGILSKNDEITIYPQKLNAKIKNIQSNSKDMESAKSYTRLALNLPKIDKNDVFRGNVISTNSYYENSKIIDILANIQTNLIIKNHSTVKLYTGTTSLNASIVNLQDKFVKKQDKILIQVRLDKEILCFVKEDIILMDTSSNNIIGSGKIINANAIKKSKIDYDISAYNIDEIIVISAIKDKKIIEFEDLQLLFEENINADMLDNALLKNEIYKYTKNTLQLNRENSGLSDIFLESEQYIENNIKNIVNYFISKNMIVKIKFNAENSKYIVIDISFYNKLKEKITYILDEYFQKNTLKSSIAVSMIHSKIPYINKKYLEAIIYNMNYKIEDNNIVIRTKNHTISDEKYGEILNIILNSTSPILIKNIATDDMSKGILYNNLRYEFVKISDDYICSNKIIENYKNVLRIHFEKKQNLEISEFKEYTNLSRKLAVIVLEYFDMQRITKRFDNYRVRYINF